MTLGFKTHFGKNPTLFTNKIVKHMWQKHGLLMRELARSREFPNFYVFEDLSNFQEEKLIPKIHTIREDSKNRWRVGLNIHFVINNRTPNRFQFAPLLPVKSIQKISVRWDEGFVRIYIDGKMVYTNIGYHPNFLELQKIGHQLAVNDGFSSIKDFLSWFSEDFEGKIIHWTDFVYS